MPNLKEIETYFRTAIEADFASRHHLEPEKSGYAIPSIWSSNSPRSIELCRLRVRREMTCFI